ncbi:MAG: tyrosine-type recombinase/integrase [Planctomycetes bacterium]|nr:tyrosine-type recombinase/integrase [Planctomycetota bacterium]
MPAERKNARIVRWRDEFYLFYFDHSDGKQRRLLCRNLGANNAEQRAELVRNYRLQEKLDETEVVRRGGRLAYDTVLVDAVDRYLTHSERREVARSSNPKAREGLSAKSGQIIRETVGHFRAWLERAGHLRLTTGRLDAALLGDYFRFVASEDTRWGNRPVRRSGATVNRYRANVKACLIYLDDLRPPLFPDFKPLRKVLKRRPTDAPQARAFTPVELTAFLEAALEWESPDVTVTVKRQKGQGKKERFQQSVSARPSTPVSRLFLLLALTGCRLGEALGLTWEDVDLERGRVTIRAQKTGRTRVLPLVGAPEGDVAPNFLDLLKAWRKEAPKAVFVLPHNGTDLPVFPKSAWQMVNERAELNRIGPQMLRQNFTSYAASLGIPSTVAALWQGHSAGVAERHYRAQVLERLPGSSIEESMGLS